MSGARWLTAVVAAFVVFSGCRRAPAAAVDAGGGEEAVAITGISPRTLSNASTTPLLVFGHGLRAGQVLHVGPPFELDLPLVVDDESHAAAVFPSAALGAQVEAAASVQLKAADGALVGSPLGVVVVNDRAFDDFVKLALSPDGKTALSVSPTTDTLAIVDLERGVSESLVVGDGPAAVDVAVLDGVPWAVVVERDAPHISLVSLPKKEQRGFAGPRRAAAVLVDGDVAYVAEHIDDSVWAIELKTGNVKWRALVDPNPWSLALVGGKLAVGSAQAGTVRLVDTATGTVGGEIAPRSGVAILGGHTEAFAADVIGGKAVRALASDGKALFVASIGPNVGPNRAKDGSQLEVSGTGGVGVVDVSAGSYHRHLAFDWGIPQALALDRKRGRLYVADVGEGLIHVVDARALAGADEKRARAAKIAEVPLSVPDEVPLVRPRADFGVNGRAGVEVHTGPSALALSPDGATLWVLERFTGRLTRVDVGDAKKGAPRVASSIALVPLGTVYAEAERRRGQVLYFADVGRTGMSCDSCHLEGHGEGVFFTKTVMMRLWRSPTVRGTRDTPPYFNPPAHETLADTASYVGARNRFQNPPLTADEVRALATYSETVVTPPNPYRNADGSLPATLRIDGDATGDPRRGRALFDARCATCHPPPLFSTDQDKATRVRFSRPDTPLVLPLRVEEQKTEFTARTPPSLVGAWDVWPMFLSAAAGFAVSADGRALVVQDRDAMRAVVDRYLTPKHGSASPLTDVERRDLLAYLRCL